MPDDKEEVSTESKLGTFKVPQPLYWMLVLAGVLFIIWFAFVRTRSHDDKGASAYDKSMSDDRNQSAKELQDGWKRLNEEREKFAGDKDRFMGAPPPTGAMPTQAPGSAPTLTMPGEDTATPEDLRQLRTEQAKLLRDSYYAPLEKQIPAEDSAAVTEALAQSVALPTGGAMTASDATLVTSPDELPKGLIPGKKVTVPAGKWIAAYLDNDVDSAAPGWARIVTQEPLIDDSGLYTVLPKGSVGLALMGAESGYDLIAGSVKEITLPNHKKLTIPLPLHDVNGIAQIQPDEIQRHFWTKFGTSIMLATIGAFAELQNPNTSTLTAEGQARAAFAQSTGQAAQALIAQYGNIPDKKLIQAGHNVNLMLTQEWVTEPYSVASFDEVMANRKKTVSDELQWLKLQEAAALEHYSQNQSPR